MINVSSAFRATMRERTDFQEYATITFANGESITLQAKDFTIKNNSVTDGAGANGIPLGCAICRNIQIEIANYNDEYSDYDFFGARINLKLKFLLNNGTTETINQGIFTVVTPETYGDTIIINAVDDMYKADKSFASNIVLPTTASLLLQNICTSLGYVLKNQNFNNKDFEITELPENDVTYRTVIGYIAQIACGNIRFDRDGYLEVLTYNVNGLSFLRNIADGGNFHYNTGTIMDGGTFAYNETTSYDGGDFDYYNIYYHVLNDFINLKVDTDDVVITGIQTKNSDDETVMYGQTGYVLSLENPFFKGKETASIRAIGDFIIGMRFRQFEGDMVSYPLADFMDYCVVVDRKGNQYPSMLTDITFNFGGMTTVKNSAESAVRNSSKYNSNAVQSIVEARKLVKQEKTDRENAVALLAQQLANSSGLYMTKQTQPDGSTIYYMHDKSTLADSTVVWKLTANALGISTDGGQTYPYGLDVSGTAILNRIYAIGIDAQYITTESLNAKGIVAGSVACENLTGTTISGKNIHQESGTAYLDISNGALVGGYTGEDSAEIDFSNRVSGKNCLYLGGTWGVRLDALHFYVTWGGSTYTAVNYVSMTVSNKNLVFVNGILVYAS